MAVGNGYNPRDCYMLMNEIVSQATGQKELAVVDTSTFSTVGETALRTGAENTLNAISIVLAKTIFSIRPYKAKLSSLLVDGSRWGAQIRKVVYLYTEAEKSTDWNTVSNPNQLDDGTSVDMYTIKKPQAVQLNFYGTQILQKHITRFRDQLSLAFSNESEFMRFIDGVMTEFFNEVEMLNESKARATLINAMAGVSSMGLTKVDLVAEFNREKATKYTRDQLLGQHLDEFMPFVASTIQVYSDNLTDNSSMYHANLTGKAPILRHTPKERQKMIMYSPIFTKTRAEVYPTLFNPKYLDIGAFEGVNYWQSKKDPTHITAKPNILNVADGSSKIAETQVDIPFVLGLLFDEEALGVMPQFDYTSVTPFNSAGGYYNMYMHWRFNSYNDFTENMVLFVLGSGT